MRVRIEFAADDRPADDPQILWADLTSQEYEGLQKAIAMPDAAERCVYIPSRIEGSRETRPWLFRLSRIKLSEA